MNDPGTEEPIKQAAEELDPSFLDGNGEEGENEEEQAIEEQDHNLHDESRWWFASTACPLIAGTFGPLASAFSICALARTWRVSIAPGQTEANGGRITDPGWLLAVNAISLAVALAANAALLLNMSGRVRFRVAQPISVIGFFFAGLLLVADLAALTAVPEYGIPSTSFARAGDAHAFSQAFYYAIQASIIYFIISMLMGLTAYGAWKKHYEAEFNLTVAQRTLMLQTMGFVFYLMIGALIFSQVEDWEYLDAIYWADLTLLTIGLGSDFHPSTHAGRTLYIFFAIGGIVIIGLVIGSIRSLVLDRGKRKISARMMEKKRLLAVNSVDPRKHRIRVTRFQTMKFDNDSLTPAKRRKLEFEVMRNVQDYAERDRKWMSLAISLTAAMALWLIGAAIFYIAERNQEWSYFVSLYFAYTCLLTIGYGDFYPQSNSGKAFFVLWTLLAVPTLTILISDMGDTVVAAFSSFTIWLGSITILPGEKGVRETAKKAFEQFTVGKADAKELKSEKPPGIMGEADGKMSAGKTDLDGKDAQQVHEDLMRNNFAERLSVHVEDEEINEAIEAQNRGDPEERDVHFYHFVLARELRNAMHDMNKSPPKKYTWEEWEYFLKLIDNEANGQELIPMSLRNPTTISKFAEKKKNQQFTWLGRDSPLLDYKTEAEWVLERLGATLERELQDERKRLLGKPVDKKKPPISLAQLIRDGHLKPRKQSDGSGTETAFDQKV